MREGRFLIEQTKWMPGEPDAPTTQSFYGACEKIDFRNSWAESYLVPKKWLNYSFSDSDKVLKMSEEFAGTVDLSTFVNSSETLFSFDSELNCVQEISYWGEGSGKEVSDVGELHINGEKETYHFAYLEAAPNFDLPQKGIHLDEYPWYQFMFARNYIPLMWNV